MPTKEEIAYKETNCIFDEHELGITGLANAMDIFARQEAIAFKEWHDENLENRTWQQYSGHDDWYNPLTGQLISTSQLYDIFLAQKRK